MVVRRKREIRIPPKPEAKSLRKDAFQLDLFTEIDDNVVKTGANGTAMPPPPNHDGGTSSIMISSNSNTPPATYPQHWPSYNLAQQNEKERFLVLLRDLCATIEQPPQAKGRPRLPLSDMVFAATFKVFSGFSSRRFTSDIQTAKRDGLIDHAPHFNSTNRYLANPALTPLLKSLVEASAAPLAAVESDFAIDSTGFATSSYHRWFDHKWGKEKSRQKFIKTHLVTGVRTNIVTAVEATAHESADAPQLTPLLIKTAETFDVRELSADKAYSRRRNVHAVQAVGATPYIPFKSSAKGQSKNYKFDGLWHRLWHFYNFSQDEFAAHYHKRSNVETTMFMIKSKFGAAVKSKSATAQVNEVLCKVLSHNLVVLIQSFYELGIESIFGCPQDSGAVVAASHVVRENHIARERCDDDPTTPGATEPKVIDLNQYRARRGL